MRGKRGIRDDATCPEHPEEIRGAKEHLTKNMVGSRYLEVDDQPAFAEHMDLAAARENCPSFEKLFRDVEGLIKQIRRNATDEQSG